MSGPYTRRKYDGKRQAQAGDENDIPEAVGVYERPEEDGLSLALIGVIVVILLVVFAAVLLLLVI